MWSKNKQKIKSIACVAKAEIPGGQDLQTDIFAVMGKKSLFYERTS